MTLGSRYINKTFKEENGWFSYLRMGEGVGNEPLIDGMSQIIQNDNDR